mmetsp:Transcript_40368/g.126298  ORF Transcript_40368/g.126298 Transcript_40368/m.126298 type:complete len:210 (-) Transcript_40368:343-972(-)
MSSGPMTVDGWFFCAWPPRPRPAPWATWPTVCGRRRLASRSRVMCSLKAVCFASFRSPSHPASTILRLSSVLVSSRRSRSRWCRRSKWRMSSVAACTSSASARARASELRVRDGVVFGLRRRLWFRVSEFMVPSGPAKPLRHISTRWSVVILDDAIIARRWRSRSDGLLLKAMVLPISSGDGHALTGSRQGAGITCDADSVVFRDAMLP